MKLKLLFFYALIPVAGYSQVGINTSNPQNTFHIDGSKDNASTGAPTATQQANDVIVTTSGNVGLGTVSPSAKLEINNGSVNGALKIIDGTQGDGKVLTSDANGLATWKSPTVTNVTGVTPSSSTPYGTSADKYMNAYVDVPQGNWFVFMGFLVNGANAANTNYASRLTFKFHNGNRRNQLFLYQWKQICINPSIQWKRRCRNVRNVLFRDCKSKRISPKCEALCMG